MKRKNRKNRGKGVKSGLEDENSKSLKIDENHIEYREKYGDHRDRAIWGSKRPGTPLESFKIKIWPDTSRGSRGRHFCRGKTLLLRHLLLFLTRSSFNQNIAFAIYKCYPLYLDLSTGASP